MEFHFEIKNKKLRKMVEEQANEFEMDVNELIWGYINRGLMSDGLSDEIFRELHSEEYMFTVIETLGLD